MNRRRGAADASIALVQVRADRGDVVAARLGVERLLGALELVPSGLPPAAILCVRELRDPLPGALSLDAPQARPPPAWERALQRELDRLARDASRPACDAVPAGAEAVVFADEAELLACLGSDLVGGSIAARWWWPLLVPGIAQPRRAVLAAWAGAIEHAPVALRALAERGEAAAFASLLHDTEAGALIDAVWARFGLPAELPDGENVEPAAPRVTLLAPPPTAPPAPWRTVAPEAEQLGLGREQRRLLGVALTLARAPALARSPAFTLAVARWRRAASQSVSVVATHASPQASSPVVWAPPPALPDRPVTPPAAVDPTRWVAEAPVAEARHAAAPPPPLEPPVAPPAPMVVLPAEPPAPSAAAPPMDAPLAPALVEAPPAPAEPAPAVPRSAPPRHLHLVRPRSRAFGPAIETELGGCFYLVDLALAMGLYGDEHNIELPLWDFVTLVARGLLGAAARPDDPVWSLLAELAGRAAAAPPGAGCLAPPDWRPPAHRLPGYQADEDPSLERWLARLIPCLRADLAHTLDVDDARLPALLLEHAAHVHVGETHIDVVLSLETLPIEIRVAGLDRDPGWIAAAGRFLAFHFE